MSRRRRRNARRGASWPTIPRSLSFWPHSSSSWSSSWPLSSISRPSGRRSTGIWPRIRAAPRRTLAGFRGRVLDREGYVLAASTPTQLIIADPQLVKDPGWTAAILAPELGIDAAVLEERLLPSSPQDRYNVIATTSDQEALAAVRALVADEDTTKAFTGVVIRPEEDRLYPAGDLARPLLGRVDPDEIGRSGVEEQFDDLLRGNPGLERYERGIFGSISVGRRTVEPAERGYDITLTLDHRIQYGTESILIDTCERLGAAGAIGHRQRAQHRSDLRDGERREEKRHDVRGRVVQQGGDRYVRTRLGHEVGVVRSRGRSPRVCRR